jgi:hypothetical protein
VPLFFLLQLYSSVFTLQFALAQLHYHVSLYAVMAALHWTQSAENGCEHDEISVNLAYIVVGIIRVSVRQKDKVADGRGAEWFVIVMMCCDVSCGDASNSPTNLRYMNILHVIWGSHTGVAKHSGLWDGCSAVIGLLVRDVLKSLSLPLGEDVQEAGLTLNKMNYNLSKYWNCWHKKITSHPRR